MKMKQRILLAGLFLLSPVSLLEADEIGELRSAFAKAVTGGEFGVAHESGAPLIAALRKEADFGETFESIAYLQAFAYASGQVGETDKANRLYEEALGFARAFDRKGGTPPQEAVALLKWATHRTESRRPVEAEALFGEALAL